MDEKRKAYIKEWRRRNRDKRKQYELNAAIRAVIAEIKAKETGAKQAGA